MQLRQPLNLRKPLQMTAHKIRPTLNLPFAASGSLGPLITYTGQNGTYFNSSGTLTAATTNVARFDYNPSTLIARGLLIEEARTNLALRSTDFGTTWALFNATVAVDQVTAPDGTVAADKLKEDNATAVHYTSQNVTITAGATYTVSLFAKQAEDRYLQIGFDSGSSNGGYATFDLQAGTVTQSANKGTGSGIAASIQAINNSWYRLIVTTVVDASSTAGRMFVVLSNSATPGFAPSYLGTTGNGAYVWGAQIEAGAFATSYIATAAASVTRAADVASITGANFTSFWNATQGTIVANVAKSSAATVGYAFVVSDGTGSNRQRVFLNTDNNQYATVTTGGVEQLTGTNLNLGSWAANTAKKVTIAYQANNFAGTSGGAAPATDSTVNLPTVDRLYLGQNENGTGSYLNGWISSLQIYPVGLTSTQIQTLST